MAKISNVPSPPIPGFTLGQTRGSDPLGGGQGRIQGGHARPVAPPARVVEKATEGKTQRKREPSKQLAQWGGIPAPPIQPMPGSEVLKRSETIGIKRGRVMREAVSVLRKPKGSANQGIAALYLALAAVDGEIEEGGRAPLLLDEKSGDAEQFAERVWDTQDPDELAELLNAALPGIELGNPRALLTQIKNLGRNQSALMDMLAGLQGIPGQGKERKDLGNLIKEEIEQLERSGNPQSDGDVDTSDVTFFRWAHLAEGQADPMGFLRTCGDVSKKPSTSTWGELMRSILRALPPGGTFSKEEFEGTVKNLILALGIQIQAIRSFFDEDRLRAVVSELQRVYTVSSLIDMLLVLRREVHVSIEAAHE